MNVFGFIRLIAVREYRRAVRRRGFLLTTLLIPIGLVLFVGLTQTMAGEEKGSAMLDAPVYVVDDSTFDLRDVVGVAPAPIVRVVSAAEAGALRASGEALETYLVPADVLATGALVRQTDVAPRTTDFTTFDRQSAQERALADYLRGSILAERGLSDDELRLVAGGIVVLEQSTPGATPVAVDHGVGAFLVPYAFALLFVMSIMMTSGYLLQSVSEEKESRIVEIVVASVPPLGLMAGKLVGLGAAGLTQVLAWVATVLVAVSLLGTQVPFLDQVAPTPTMLALAVVYFVLGYLVYGAIYSAAGAVGSTTQESAQLGAFAAIFAALPIMLTMLFMTDPSSLVATALVLFPLTAPAAALQVVAFAPSIPWPLVGASLLLLAGGALVATVAGARIFRASLLLSGTRPSARQVLRALRGD